MTKISKAFHWRPWLSLLMGIPLIFLAACANVSHVVIYQDNQLGIKGSYSSDTNSGTLVIGYRNKFASLIPKVDPAVTGSDYQAASVYAGSQMVVHGLGVPDVDEITATGQAAIYVASSSGGQAPFVAITHGTNGSNSNH